MKRSRLDTIQALRGFAALAVVAYHAIETIANDQPSLAIPQSVTKLAWLGNFGVDIFFVISGFIMIYVHYEDFSQKRAQTKFLKNRIKRIAPNYWILTSIGAFLLLTMPGLSNHGRTFDVSWILASYLFIPWTSQTGIPLPVLGAGWTLNFEMYFYIIFSFMLLFSRPVGVSILALFFTGSIFAGMIFHPTTPFLKEATSWLLAEFLMGVMLGVIFKIGITIPSFFGYVLIAVAAFTLLESIEVRAHGGLPRHTRFFLFGLPALAVVAAATLPEGARNLRVPSPLLLLGNASYALYLTHVFTLPFTKILLSFLGVALPYYITALTLVLSAVFVAIPFYKFIERPMHKALRPRSLTKANQ